MKFNARERQQLEMMRFEQLQNNAIVERNKVLGIGDTFKFRANVLARILSESEAVCEDKIPQWLDDAFTGAGYTRIICNWADALYSNDGINIECVIVTDEKEKSFPRLFCAESGDNDGGYMKYIHSFVNNVDEVACFIATVRMMPNTQN